MTFKSKITGALFDSPGAVVAYLCKNRSCLDCPLMKVAHGDSDLGCFDFAEAHPEQLAEMLNLEIVNERAAYARLIGLAEPDPKVDKTDMVNQPPHYTSDGMNQERFEALVQEIREKSMDTLLKKNANYGSADKLHNFRRGAAIIGCTPAQAALGYMTKHMASLIDKIQNNDFRDRDDFLEKIQDSINYLVFIWCCGNEERDKQEASDD